MKFRLVENILLDEKDKYINFDKFENSDENVLLITGFSGSGKTTLADKLSKQYSAIPVELDNLEMYLNAPKEALNWLKDEPDYDLLLNFIEKYYITGIKPYNNSEITEYYNLYFKDILNYCHKHKNQKFIINGLQIYDNISEDLIKGLPIIIMGTSLVNSTNRAAKRDADEFGLNKFKELKRLASYAANDNKNLNRLKNSVDESLSEYKKQKNK